MVRGKKHAWGHAHSHARGVSSVESKIENGDGYRAGYRGRPGTSKPAGTIKAKMLGSMVQLRHIPHPMGLGLSRATATPLRATAPTLHSNIQTMEVRGKRE